MLNYIYLITWKLTKISVYKTRIIHFKFRLHEELKANRMQKDKSQRLINFQTRIEFHTKAELLIERKAIHQRTNVVEKIKQIIVEFSKVKIKIVCWLREPQSLSIKMSHKSVMILSRYSKWPTRWVIGKMPKGAELVWEVDKLTSVLFFALAAAHLQGSGVRGSSLWSGPVYSLSRSNITNFIEIIILFVHHSKFNFLISDHFN